MAWWFLSAGKTHDEALSILGEVEAAAQTVQGSLGIDWTLAADRYLRWSEDAERRLSDVFASSAVPRTLLSDRYWHIRAMSEVTHRPIPLIEGEIRSQLCFLQGLRQQVGHYRDVLRVRDDERLILLDTNVLVHGQSFQHVTTWGELADSRRVRIIVPFAIVDELDILKDRGIREAGGVLKVLDGLLPPGGALDRVRVRDRVELQVLDEPLGHTRLARTDDELVRQARYIDAATRGALLVVTRDRGMRVRCEYSKVAVQMLPSSLERRRVEGSHES